MKKKEWKNKLGIVLKNDLYQKYQLMKSPSLDAPIKHFYKEEIFSGFLRYCRIKGARKFSELTVDFIERFQYQKDVRRESMIKAMELYHEIHRQSMLWNFAVRDAVTLLQNNSLKSILEFTLGDYLAFIDEFLRCGKPEIYQADFPFEKVQKICKRANDKSEENRLYNSMELIVQGSVTQLQNNRFKFLVDFTNDDYLSSYR